LILANPVCCRRMGQRMQFDRLKRREFITLIGDASKANMMGLFGIPSS
jgi:hypothetical protein